MHIEEDIGKEVSRRDLVFVDLSNGLDKGSVRPDNFHGHFCEHGPIYDLKVEGRLTILHKVCDR